MTIQGKYKLKGSLKISGDKSISHRSILLGAMSVGETKISNLLESKDTLSTINILRKLGVIIKKRDNKWIVNGVGTCGFIQPKMALDCGNSGTTSRLLFGAVATNPIFCTFIGDNSLSSRPMSRITEYLSRVGAEISLTRKNYLPLTIKGSQNLLPLKHTIIKPSAQVKSSLMLAALNISGQTTVVEKIPTRDHTEILFRYLNIKFKKEIHKNKKTILKIFGPAEIKAKNISVASDPSSAAFFIVGALILPGSDIEIKDVCLNKTRIAYIQVLKKMGGKIKITKKGKLSGEIIGNIRVKYSRLKPTIIPKKMLLI